MVVQRDYILRLIEQFGQFVTALVNLRRNGQLAEARDVVDQALLGLVGMDLRTASEQPAARLIDTVRFAMRMYATGSPAAQQLNLLGRLLREAAAVLDAQGDGDTAARVRMQALEVHLAVLEVDLPSSADASEGVDTLLEELREFELPPAVQRQVWATYAARGEYARAENWLFHALDDDPADTGLLEDAIATFTHLLTLDDATLESGGLSRSEVRATLEELQGRAER